MVNKLRSSSSYRYFEDDEEHQAAAAAADDDLEYLPAPGSPSLDRKNAPVAAAARESSSDSDSDDPLESFMADIEVRLSSTRNFITFILDSRKS